MDGGSDTATTLGPVSGEGCFHVWHVKPTSYRFLIDEVEYPDGLAGGKVQIFVTAGRFVDLRPRPVELPRRRRLEFSAEGQARGPLELTMSLVDSHGRMSEPTWMNTICPTSAR